MNSWHPLTKAMTAIGGLAIVVLALTHEGDHQTTAIASTASVERTVIADKVEALDIPKLAVPVPDNASIQEMVERPLFSLSRRPPESEEPPPIVHETLTVEEPVVVISEPEMAFVGSVIRNDIVSALITKGYGETLQEVGLGEEIDGWKVLEIGDRAISLGFNDKRLEYRIFEGNGR